MSLIKHYLQEYYLPKEPTMNQLEMLTAREQLMEDIDSICDEFFCHNFPNSKEQFDELTRVLCDAVCKNFPTK